MLIHSQSRCRSRDRPSIRSEAEACQRADSILQYVEKAHIEQHRSDLA